MSDKIKVLNHKEELKEFVKIMDDYDKFNTVGDLFNWCDRQRWHAQLGKFIYDTYGENMPQEFKKLQEIISKEIHDKSITSKGADKLDTLTICYLANYLNTPVLEPVFGKPLFHNRFGEGWFTEEDGSLTIRCKGGHPEKNHASYFLEICGIKVHIGYDHRGTQVDIGQYKDKKCEAEIAFYLMLELIKAVHKGEKI